MSKCDKTLIVDGAAFGVDFVRRRYGRAAWYCWVYAEGPGIPYQGLGDPWPVHTAPDGEIVDAIRSRLAGGAALAA